MEGDIDGLLKALAQGRRGGNDLVAVLGDAPADGWAPLALAQLLREGWLRWAVLDRYDPRWLQACVLCGVAPAVCDLAAGAVPPQGAAPALLFRLGQGTQAAAPLPELSESACRRLRPGAVVVDCSGAWIEALSAHGQPASRLFLVGAEDNGGLARRGIQPLPAMAPEQLLVSLARAANVFPPQVLIRPLGAVQDCVAGLPPLQLAGGAVQLNLAEPLNHLLEDAAERAGGGDGRLAADERQRQWRQYSVQLALLAGDYDAAAAGLAGAEEEGGDDHGKRLLVWCLLEQAGTLCRQAAGAAASEAGQSYARAGELFRRVLDLQPDNFDAYAQWGAALQAQGQADRESAPRYYRAAAEKYRAALTLRGDADVCFRWGAALQGQAEAQLGDAADALYRQATEKYAQALELRPEFHQVLWQWGEALRNQAAGKRGSDADELYRQAEEKFAAAAALQPDDGAMVNRWGLVLLELGNRAMGEQRRQLLDEASRRFRQAERLSPGVAAYDLACLASLRRDEAEARMWLLKARESGTLPSAQHVIADPDLDWLRQAPWLAELLAGR